MNPPEETFKEIMERFEDRLDTAIYDAERVSEHREEYLDFLKDSLIKFGESLIGEPEKGGLRLDTFKEGYKSGRVSLQDEQRQELEKISK